MLFLCEGDPLLYGSFAHLLPRLGTRFECEVIPGISSIGAAAAAAQLPLGIYEEPIALIPATMPAEPMAAILERCDRVVVMKVGRHLARMQGSPGSGGHARARPCWSRTSPCRRSASGPWPMVDRAGRALLLADPRRPEARAGMTLGPAIVMLGPRSAALALRLRALLPGSRIHAPACADCEADVRFAKATAAPSPAVRRRPRRSSACAPAAS